MQKDGSLEEAGAPRRPVLGQRLAFVVAAMIFVVSALANVAPARADDDDPMEPNAELRLDAWLESRGNRARGGRIAISAVTGAMGIAGTVGGVWALSQDNLTPDALLWGSLGAAIGPLSIAECIYLLANRFPQELRLERWRRASKDGASPEEIARFEGELRDELDNEAWSSRFGVAIGLGMAGGGLFMAGLGLVGPERSREEQVFFFASGGTLAVSGGLIALITWLSSSGPTDWENYEDGHMPEARSRFVVTPAFAADSVGVSASGVF